MLTLPAFALRQRFAAAAARDRVKWRPYFPPGGKELKQKQATVANLHYQLH